MKKISLSFGAVCADVYFFPGGAARSLLLLEPVRRDLSRLPLYRKDGAFLTAVSGMDWERNMTPWPAPPLVPGGHPFGGGAEEFLAFLLQKVLPEAEAAAGAAPNDRAVLGTSLGGLFALRAACRTEAFSACAALSGSFWYPGFTEWLRRNPCRARRCFLGLGRKEAETRHPLLASIGTRTAETAAILREEGITVEEAVFPGGHHAGTERLAAALRWALDEK